MIDHQRKCIFIHISKCAGSSIETGFGIKTSDNSEKNNPNLYGWNSKAKLHLQHATPQQLFDFDLITEKEWNTYFKFIVVRNPYSRSVSDYFWMMEEVKVSDSFENFMNLSGAFEIIKDRNNPKTFRADHLNKQHDYFFLNGKPIIYDKIIRFENIYNGLKELKEVFNLPRDSFNRKNNASKSNFAHYSHFYNTKRKRLVEEKFGEDLDFLNYDFEDKRSFLNKMKNNLFS